MSRWKRDRKMSVDASDPPEESLSDQFDASDAVHSGADEHEPAKVGKLSRFRSWRRNRPFTGGLLLILAGIVILVPAYLSIRILDLLVMISTISGVSVLIVGSLLIMFGIGAWFKPATAPYLGVLGILVGIVALPTSNFGGFLLGSGLAIVGGALTLAWEDRTKERSKSRDHKKKSKSVAVVTATLGTSSLLIFGTTSPIAGQSYAQPAPPSLGPILGLNLPEAIRAPSLPRQDAPLIISNAERNVPNPLPLVGETTTVTADEILVSGNASISVVKVQTQTGLYNMIRLSGTTVKVQNISFDIPGRDMRGDLSTGQPQQAVLQGEPATVYARTLDFVPAVGGVSTIPISLDVEGNLEKVIDELDRLGYSQAPLPDPLLSVISLKNVSLGTLGVEAKTLTAPGVVLEAMY